MRAFLAAAVGIFLSAACWAGAGEPLNPEMKALFDEIKSFAESEKAFREGKRAEVQALESRIDGLRADAKARGEAEDPPDVKPLQLKRLATLEEVARRDVAAAEKNVAFSQRKLEIARQNLEAFERRKSEAEQTIALS